MNDSESPAPFLFNNWITVKDAAYFSGYNIQYLRRMLRFGVLDGVKIGHMWLIEIEALEAHLKQAENKSDHRCGPK